MGLFDDDFLKPLFPTRNGPAAGKSIENRMLQSVGGPDAIRTKIIDNPDGTTTMLRTRNGAPEFTTTGGKKPLICDLFPLIECYTINGTSVAKRSGYDRLHYNSFVDTDTTKLLHSQDGMIQILPLPTKRIRFCTDDNDPSPDKIVTVWFGNARESSGGVAESPSPGYVAVEKSGRTYWPECFAPQGIPTEKGQTLGGIGWSFKRVKRMVFRVTYKGKEGDYNFSLSGFDGGYVQESGVTGRTFTELPLNTREYATGGDYLLKTIGFTDSKTQWGAYVGIAYAGVVADVTNRASQYDPLVPERVLALTNFSEVVSFGAYLHGYLETVTGEPRRLYASKGGELLATDGVETTLPLHGQLGAHHYYKLDDADLPAVVAQPADMPVYGAFKRYAIFNRGYLGIENSARGYDILHSVLYKDPAGVTWVIETYTYKSLGVWYVRLHVRYTLSGLGSPSGESDVIASFPVPNSSWLGNYFTVRPKNRYDAKGCYVETASGAYPVYGIFEFHGTGSLAAATFGHGISVTQVGNFDTPFGDPVVGPLGPSFETTNTGNGNVNADFTYFGVIADGEVSVVTDSYPPETNGDVGWKTIRHSVKYHVSTNYEADATQEYKYLLDVVFHDGSWKRVDFIKTETFDLTMTIDSSSISDGQEQEWFDEQTRYLVGSDVRWSIVWGVAPDGPTWSATLVRNSYVQGAIHLGGVALATGPKQASLSHTWNKTQASGGGVVAEDTVGAETAIYTMGYYQVPFVGTSKGMNPTDGTKPNFVHRTGVVYEGALSSFTGDETPNLGDCISFDLVNRVLHLSNAPDELGCFV